MKRILLSLVAIATITLSSFGQTPEGFKYQAVVRNASNTILTNQAVGLRMTIQQDAIGGTTVYSETFATITSANGLVNVEIGNGTVVSGTFANIDWSAGPYFMETAVDVTGGTNYTVMGTSQLMSVPYALYAKTSGNGQGPAGPQGNQGPAGPQGNQGPTGSYPVHTIGEFYGGGVVFYVYDGGTHGLIAATEDQSQSTGIMWCKGPSNVTLARANGIGAGLNNTAIIIANQGSLSAPHDFAATVCNEYSKTVDGTTYGDWYLPSQYELNLLYLQKDLVNSFGADGFMGIYYWSSTEISSTLVWGHNFATGYPDFTGNKYSLNHVRAIRAF